MLYSANCAPATADCGLLLLLLLPYAQEVEDNGGLWLSGRSLISAAGSSNIQIQLSHVLVEGSSSVTVESGSEWNMTQEFDMTPAQVRLQRFSVIILAQYQQLLQVTMHEFLIGHPLLLASQQQLTTYTLLAKGC